MMWSSTHTFHFPWGKIASTPVEFVVLTGAPIDNWTLLGFDKKIKTKAKKQHWLPRGVFLIMM